MEKSTLPQNVMLCDRERAIALIPQFKTQLDQVAQLKRGDWIRCLIEWQDAGEVRCEFLTCLVAALTPSGLVKCRVLSNPDYKARHSISYGDDLTISTKHIVVHDPMPTTAADAKGNTYPLSQEQIERNILILLAPSAQPLAPSPGKQYWTRNGTTAQIWTMLQDTGGRYFIGEAGGIRDIQWTPEGKHRQGNPTWIL